MSARSTSQDFSTLLRKRLRFPFAEPWYVLDCNWRRNGHQGAVNIATAGRPVRGPVPGLGHPIFRSVDSQAT